MSSEPGGWSGWSVWSACSRSCGSGVTTRRRTCTAPSPSYGGADCAGEGEERKACKLQDCCEYRNAEESVNRLVNHHSRIEPIMYWHLRVLIFPIGFFYPAIFFILSKATFCFHFACVTLVKFSCILSGNSVAT